MKSLGSPPIKVVKVMAIVLRMFNKLNLKAFKNENEKNSTVWRESSKLMANPRALLESMINYDIQNIDPKMMKMVDGMFKDGELTPETVR